MNFHRLYVIIVIYNIDQYPLSVHIISEEYEDDNVIVTLRWTRNQQLQGGDILSYNASVLPSVPLIFNGTSLELALEYNTEYNLTVEADIQCGPNATGFISLNYGEP